MIVKGSCNMCGQCCGKDNKVPAFGWSFWEICFQSVDNPDLSLQGSKATLFALVRDALDKPRKVNVGGTRYNVLLKTGAGLVKSDNDHSCPFQNVDGSCGVWDEDWCVELCHDTFPRGNTDVIVNDKRLIFFDRHPLCSYYVEAV